MRNTGTKTRMGAAFILSLVITGLYFLAVYQEIPIIYDINDDVAMRNAAAGVITGTPDAHLIFMKYILGLVISSLYQQFPGLDWYGLVLIGIMLFSFAMILYRGLVEEKPLWWKAVYTVASLLLFTCVGLQHIASFQWTVAAAMAGASGIYLFYTSQTRDRFQMAAEEGMAVFLLLLCLAVRDSVFLMILPAAGLCFLWKYGSFEKEGRWPFALRHMAVPAALVLGGILIFGVERYAYRSAEWKEFLAYNEDRSTIMDYYELKNYEENAEFYDSLSLSPEEVENLQRYSLYMADDVYSQKMHALAVNAEETYMQQNPVRSRIRMGIEKVWEHLRSPVYAPFSLLTLCLTVLVLALGLGKSRRQFLLSLCCLGFWALFWLYLGFEGRVVERVVYAMYFLQFLNMMAIGYRILVLEEGDREPQKWRLLPAVFLCLLLFAPAGRKWKAVEDNSGWRSAYNREFLDVNRYMAQHPENVYFMTTFSIETYTDNFTVRRDFDFTNLLSVGGWHTFSPLEEEKNAKLHITDPKRDIAEKDNVYVISLENVNLRYLDRYYTSLYGEGYRGRELVDRLDYGAQVFEVYDFTAEEQKRGN